MARRVQRHPSMETTKLEWTTEKYKATRRENGTCPVCKKHHTRLLVIETSVTRRSDMNREVSRNVTERNEDGTRAVALTCCGTYVKARTVKGSYRADVKCGAKCLSSRGHLCECSCGGKNHGSNA